MLGNELENFEDSKLRDDFFQNFKKIKIGGEMNSNVLFGIFFLYSEVNKTLTEAAFEILRKVVMQNGLGNICY